MSRLPTAAVLLFALLPACNKQEAGATPQPTKAAPVADASAAGHPAAAPTAPHNPHAGNMPPPGMRRPPAREPGPPRDVTPSGETVPATVAELELAVPKEWEAHPPAGTMRVAEYTWPGPGGDVDLVVYRFHGGAGGTQANIDRWKQQFQPAEGKSIDDVTKIETTQAGDLKETYVDITGRYTAAVRPGAEEKHDDPDSRMVAAIVEGSGDPFFFKAVGPAKTVDLWADAFQTMLKGLKKKG